MIILKEYPQNQKIGQFFLQNLFQCLIIPKKLLTNQIVFYASFIMPDTFVIQLFSTAFLDSCIKPFGHVLYIKRPTSPGHCRCHSTIADDPAIISNLMKRSDEGEGIED